MKKKRVSDFEPGTMIVSDSASELVLTVETMEDGYTYISALYVKGTDQPRPIAHALKSDVLVEEVLVDGAVLL